MLTALRQHQWAAVELSSNGSSHRRTSVGMVAAVRLKFELQKVIASKSKFTAQMGSKLHTRATALLGFRVV
jgi:hypothetical protein